MSDGAPWECKSAPQLNELCQQAIAEGRMLVKEGINKPTRKAEAAALALRAVRQAAYHLEDYDRVEVPVPCGRYASREDIEGALGQMFEGSHHICLRPLYNTESMHPDTGQGFLLTISKKGTP